MERFVQQLPPLPDVYAADPALGATLDRVLGEAGHKEARPALEALAAEVAGPLRAAHREAEAHPPQLVRYDGWGRRVDRLETPAGWEAQRVAAARHGLVALPYEDAARRAYGSGARLLQLALLHLFGPESATFSCPVAMADGAARLLGRPDVAPEVRDAWLPRLLSRDPDRAITSGQWMTETTGGSDVGGTATAARQSAQGWRLSGEKWFCSAADAAMAVALARPEGAAAGSRGLACFLVPRYAGDVPGAADDPRDVAPGLRLHRLKDKLGTRPLPSAEIGLRDAHAWPLGDPTRPGLARMMQLAQVTRLHNTAAAAAGMRRGLLYVRGHAAARTAFGVALDRQPLHRETLGWLAVDADAAWALAALCFGLLGRVEVDDDAEAAALLRLAATLAKAVTGKLAVASASEYVECFGGNGYIEDTGVPRLLRDAQVLPIWEGTTNVLSLDAVRALGRPETAGAFLRYVDATLEAAAGQPALGRTVSTVHRARTEVASAVTAAPSGEGAAARAGTTATARALTIRLGHLLAAVALLEQATFDAGRGDERSAVVAELWARRRLGGDPVDGAGDAQFALLLGDDPR